MQGSARSLAWVMSFVVACSARGNEAPAGPTDAGTGTDVPAAADTPAGTDAPVGSDVPVTTDNPVATDVPAPIDTPVATDVPAGTDVPAPIDRPVAMDVPAPMDVPPASTASQQIAAVRATIPGPAALRVDGAVVTYLVPATLRSDGTVSPSDPAGFFVQADRTGPALFVAVNPATLSPPPAQGDRVGFTVTQVSSPTPSTHWAAQIGGYTRSATGVAVGALLQDLSGASDLVTNLLAYEHELITLTGTVTSDFGSGGTGFLQASIATAALPADALLKLRVPTDLRTTLGLRNGCRFTINATPMWRFDVTAQASAWRAGDISGITCPVPDAGTVTDLGPETGDDRIWVVRVGDGVSTLSGTAVPVNIETYVGGVAGATIALPTVALGSNRPLTLAGNAGAEGTLTRSANRAWAVLGGYTLPVGTAVVGSAQGPRVIARINAAGAVDTRTVLGTTVETAAIRGVVSVDGSEFWSIHSFGSNGDVVYTAYGATSGLSVAGRDVFRGINLFGQQILAANSNTTSSGVFATTALPRTAGSTIALLPGFPLNMTLSPYGIAAYDRDGNGALDVMFLADDRSVLSGGGIQCWRLIGSTWTQVGNVTGLTNGFRMMTGRTNGANYVFYAATAESRARLQRIDVDGATLVGVVSTIAQAPLNTTYRGVSFAPR
ncbi:MAG: uncharacterized protein JWM10_4945 [Myxococcaceae bacterium]|nr:uncharacterized protein [Myxococcaceae bacterium]